MSVQTYQTYAPTTAERATQLGAVLVKVVVDMPHVARWGRPTTMTLTYATKTPVRVGQKVLCPPSRLGGRWTRGTVVQVGSSAYAGPVKYVKPLGH